MADVYKRQLFLLPLWLWAQPQQTDSIYWFTITYIVDGDTFDGVNATGQKIRFRPIGMDTPETGYRNNKPEPYHQEATNWTRQQLLHKRVRIAYDVTAQDHWGRHLVYVFMADGRLFNEEIVREGWAVVATYPPNVRYVERLTTAQRKARQAGRGVWQ